MTNVGTVFKSNATKAMLLGSGELGREVVIELKRLGLEVIAVDKYANAPAMQVADRSYVISMLDAEKLEEVIRKENPNYIIPEVEAIATSKLVELEEQGFRVIPTAKAVNFTMNREGIRTLAAEKLGMKTSPYAFATTFEEFEQCVEKIGLPCVVKPVMSSSGHGQSVVKTKDDIKPAWDYSQSGGRAGSGKVIVEGFVDFDYEITLLTVRHSGGTSFCAPIGHQQIDGDYRRSWQPHPMSDIALDRAKEYAKLITDALGGYGIFGVEMFIKGDEVLFSEVSPRPHDTGMVTMISQNLSQFALHARAILGIPIANIEQYSPAASRAVVVEGNSAELEYCNLDKVLSRPKTDMRIFGKPCVVGHRRMAVLLARGDTIEQADSKTAEMLKDFDVKLS
ncbi:MAG: formate-dependent phosphoribosylglycinamide formyltransferase [Verrucomicrobiaceae bacterium]|nr:formate-dependent phosphoribosylglycinamide formyltransferase [Verrucomicrobiaceae bacterium]